MTVEELSGTWGTYKDPLPAESTNYMDAPLMTLRDLMPGDTGKKDDDPELDKSFRADKVEFMVVQRILTADEAREHAVIEDAADVD